MAGLQHQEGTAVVTVDALPWSEPHPVSPKACLNKNLENL
jgi:hypothetical protein